MKKPIIVLGIGELGSVFARAFLKNVVLHEIYSKKSQ
jgi:prephenate dehydrogenase